MATVVFDLDGTLADTAQDLIAAANATFEAQGHPPQLDPLSDARTAFRGARAMLRLGFERLGVADAAARIEQSYPETLRLYEADIARHSRFYPGALDAVARLRALGLATAICTNKPVGLARKLMAELGGGQLFDSLVGGDTLPVRKPDPAPLLLSIEHAGGAGQPAVLLGDTESDTGAARAAGIPCVLVTFGPDGKAVSALEPAGMIDHFDRIEEVVLPLLKR
ncbi:MAG: HAD hydrolase-like protein [Pseudomonadota bacterium]